MTVMSFGFTVSLLSFELPFVCAPATLAAPATTTPITAPKTVDFILPPEMKQHQEAHQVWGHA
jgi:hypothetical protein